MRQGYNSVELIGTLLEMEVKHENNVTRKIGDTTLNCEKIELQLVLDCGEGREIPVKLSSYSVNAEGKENGLYKSYMTMANEYKTVAKYGIEEADMVVINKATLRPYATKNKNGGKLNFGCSVQTNFANRVEDKSKVQKKAFFSVEGIVNKVFDVVEDNIPCSDKCKVELLLTVGGFGSIPLGLEKATFIVEGEDKVDYVRSVYIKGATVSVDGNIDFYKKVEKQVIKRSFGDDKETPIVTTIRNLVITGGSGSYAEENPTKEFPKEEWTELYNEMEKRHRDLLLKEENKPEQRNSFGGASTSATNTTVKTETNKTTGIDIGDIPF
ncbi:hypothetical protein N2W52_002028 [Clostridium perfringens]|nr:hypothetical protein [Clostridium perfringens]